MTKNRHSSADQKFFRQIWAERPHDCEECNRTLLAYSATYISHYLPKGRYPTLRYEERNINILCAEHHFKWDFGDKKKMRIYSEEKREGLIRLAYGVKGEVNG